MLKLMTFAAGLALCGILFSPQLAAAGPVPFDGDITIAAADTSATEGVPLSAAACEIERIVFYNSGAATCAVSVAVTDIGVSTALDTFALAATSGASQYPPGRQRVTYEQTAVVTGNVAIVRLTSSTNWVPILARDLTITVAKPTNATDCVYFYRVYTRDPGRLPGN
jgi:subtilisin family serine protease